MDSIKILLNLPLELDDALRWASYITRDTRQKVIRDALILYIKSLQDDKLPTLDRPKKPRGRPKSKKINGLPSLKDFSPPKNIMDLL